MPIDSDTFFRERQVILSEMLAALVSAVPDAYTGEDGIMRIMFEIEASQLESLFLANQLVLEDMFIQHASIGALRMHGIERGLPILTGLSSTGALRFTGTAGTYIPIESNVAANPGETSQVIYFITTQDGTIPNLGVPIAPTANVGPAGALTGLYEYVVTFASVSGETLPSSDSNAINPNNEQISLSAIPLGGVGTTQRKIYRQKNGVGPYYLVATIADNTTMTYTDNMDDATAATRPTVPTVDTSNVLIVSAQAESPGLDGNVAANTITELTNVPAGVLSVSNPAPFTGGTDEEDTERYRQRLLEWVRNPQSGSPDDLKAWAESIPGVESATVFPNNNLGTPQNGHVTVRISGPGGLTPSADLIESVQGYLQSQDMANITIHTAAFTAVPTDVAVDVTLEGTFTLNDVIPSVQVAIQEYVNNLEVGATLYVSGIVDAVFGLPGISDVVVTNPATNLTTPADAKRSAGVITVT